jgi:hypothetical protein
MADKKITQLPSLTFISGSTTGYYAGEVVLPIVHNSTTVKIEASSFARYATQWSATTASNTFIGNQTVNGNVVITGKLTAQELFTEITSASIIFESGSTLFGNTADDTHTFTGTINVNGKVVGNAPLDFTSQSLNVQTGSQELINLRISSVTGSMNTQSSSQDSVNYRNSTVSSSLNFATSSLNFASGALNIATGSYNRFYDMTSSVHFTTQSLNVQTGSQESINVRISSTTGSINTTTSSFDSVFLGISSVTGSINTQSSSQDLVNFRNSTFTSSLNFATSSLNSFTGSIISQTNTIATFTSSVNFATSSLNTQTGSQDLVNLRISSTTGSINNTTSSFDSVFLRISSVTGSMNTQSSSQDLVNYQNSIVTSSFRNEIGGIEAYTASLKSAIVVNGTNVRIIGELTASRIYTEFITSSVLFVTGSNIIGDQLTDKHEFTGSVNINNALYVNGQLFVNGQAIGLGELNAFTGSQIGKDFTLSVVTSSIDAHILKQATQTGSQDLVNLSISTYTGSQNLINSSVDVHILKQATQTGSQDLVNLGISSVTGSLIGITNGLMAFTAALDSTYATDAQLYQLYQATQSLELHSGSMIGITNALMAFTAALDSTYATDAQLYQLYAETASIKAEIGGIEAYTASLKGAAIVSSSQQITNYYKFAETASANIFYGTQTISGSLIVSSSAIFSTGSVGIGRRPEFTLDVDGDIAINRFNKLQFTGGTVGDRARSYLAGDGNNNIFVYGPSSNLITTFAYTGTVGIGPLNITPDTKLHISGSDGIKIQAGGNADIPGLTIINHTNQYGWAKFGGGLQGNGNGYATISNWDGASVSEKVRVSGDGYLRLAGGGIQFNGDTAAANSLNDYEEGIIAATVTCSTSGTVTLDSGYNSLAYVKVGSIVHLTGLLSVTSVSSPVGAFSVPLPFTVANLADAAGTSAASVHVDGTDTANSSDFCGIVNETETALRVYLGSGTTLASTSAQQLKTGSSIYISVTYRTS